MKVRLVLVAAALAAAQSLVAQVPSAIMLLRARFARQESAGGFALEGAGVAVGATFPTAVGGTVQLRAPGGALHTLHREPDGTYYFQLDFGDAAAVMSAFPDGSYALVVSGSSPSTTTFSVALGAPTAPVLLTNIDALQAWPNLKPELKFEPIPNVGLNDRFGVKVKRADGTLLVDYTSNAATTGGPVTSSPISTNLPFSEPLEAAIGYFRVTSFSANSGATAIQLMTGFQLNFPLRIVLAPAIISQQPASQTKRIGEMLAFQVVTLPSPAQTYVLKKDGVPVPGVQPEVSFGSYISYRLPVTSLTDAGVYTVEVWNGDAVTTTDPAIVVIGPWLNVTTFAGSGAIGGADGAAATAQFAEPSGLAFDAAGNLHVADRSSGTIRVISPAGVVRTLAGSFREFGMADGVGAAARFGGLMGLAFDGAGNLHVADYSNHSIRKITPDGVVTTVAGTSGTSGSADGTGAAARFVQPVGLAFDPAGNLYITDSGNRTVRRMTPAGVVTTLAGLAGSGFVHADGTGSAARFRNLGGCRFYAGNLYVADTGSVRRVSPEGVVTTLKGLSVDADNPAEVNGDTVGDLAIDAGGVFYLRTSSGLRRMTIGGPTTTVAPLLASSGLAIDAQGAVYYSDSLNSVIRKGVPTPMSTDPRLTLTIAPRSQTVGPGASVALTAQGTGPSVRYQWQKDGVGLAGATAPTLVLQNTTAADAGTYSVLIGNTVGAIAPPPATIAFSNTTDVGRVINLSVRSNAGTDAQTLIAGLVLRGAPGATRPLLIRGVGPSLVDYDVPGALTDPVLTLVNETNTTLAANNDWGGTAALRTAFDATGAFPLAAASRDAALSTALGSGLYSVRVTGSNNASGIALLEVYDLAANSTTNPVRLVNISTRTQVGTGSNILIAGFAVIGATSKTFLIRGVGSSLTAYGVTGTLADPKLAVYDSANRLVASNDNWTTGGDAPGQTLARVGTSVGAFALSSFNDAAVVVTLPPGTYTAQVSGVNGTTGVGLIEIYDVP